jgi:hypothetical protein
LGQSYIQELRRGLMTAVLAKRNGPSVGITIARITNDLSSVRNWVSMRIAPLAVGIPLIIGATIALWPEGYEILANVLKSYPGVAIIASDHPEQLVPRYSIWDLR